MHGFCPTRRIAAACLAAALLAMSIVCYAWLEGVIWPEEGENRILSDNLEVDASHMEDGYILARGEASSQKYKLRITAAGMTYMYDLNSQEEFEVFPLQMGSGTYLLELYRNVKGDKYSKDAEISLAVEMSNENAPFLCPNQYVNYTQDSLAVQTSQEVCASLTSDQEKLNAIGEYISSHITYDFARAASINSSYLGDADGCLTSQQGLCQDIAVLAACMLRTQSIPTKLAIGYIGRYYHAWNYVLIDGEYQLVDFTAQLANFPPNMGYTPERYY